MRSEEVAGGENQHPTITPATELPYDSIINNSITYTTDNNSELTNRILEDYNTLPMTFYRVYDIMSHDTMAH